MSEKKATRKFDKTGMNIYGKGKSVISFAPIKHERDNSTEEKENDITLKGYKLNVTATLDNFNTKDHIYLEQDELLDFLLVLKGKISEMKGVRNGETSNANKSFKVSKMSSGDIICSFDIETKKEKMNFKISRLNQLVLVKILKGQLRKEIKRRNNISFTEIELENYINDLYSEIDSTSNINTKNKTSVKENNSNSLQLKFINSYNGKDYDNKLDVKSTIYDYIKTTDLSPLDNIQLNKLLKKIKDNTDKEQNKFLTIDNINTLSII